MPFLQHEIGLAQAVIAIAEQAVAAAAARLQQANQDRTTAAAQVAAADQAVAAQSTERDARAADLARADVALSAAQADAAAARQAVADLDKQIADHDASPPDPPEPPADGKPSPGAWAAYRQALARWRAEGQSLAAARQAAAARIPGADQQVANATNTRSAAAGVLANADAALTAARSNAAAARQNLANRISAIADAQHALDAAQAQSNNSPARARVAQLALWSATIDKQPFDRAPLEAAAASLGAELQDLRASLADAQARAASAVGLRATVTPARDAAQAQLTAQQAQLASVQAAVQNFANQATAALAARQAAAAELQRIAGLISAQLRARPPRPRVVGKPLPNGGPDLEAWQQALEDWKAALQDLRDQHNSAARAYASADQQWQDASSHRDQSQTQLNSLNTAVSSLLASVGSLNKQLAENEQALQVAQGRINDLTPRVEDFRLARETATARLLGDVTSELAIVLLPVRVETRFADGRTTQLLVRIYPDDCYVDTHEPELTDEEETWGKHFWDPTVYGTDEAAHRRAWQQLVDRFGAHRAAWITQLLDPSGHQQYTKRGAAWTRPPLARVLPDRWVVIAYQHGQVALTAWGAALTPDPQHDARQQLPMPTGPSPHSANGTAPHAFDDDGGMRWMLDFNTAVSCGMGVQIPLTQAQATQGFDRLLVLGIAARFDGPSASRHLQELLTAHHYTDGLALLRQGTPTNNTKVASSGYSSQGIGDTYAVERGAALVKDGDGSDADLVAHALRLPTTVFGHVEAASSTDQADAQAFNTALWPIVGMDFLHRQTSPAPPDTIARMRGHFLDYVRASGPLPALRLGKQPYGILPVTSLERWTPGPSADTPPELVNSLRQLHASWRAASTFAPRISHAGDMSSLLRQEALSYSYAARSFQNGSAVYPPLAIAHPHVQAGNKTGDDPLDPNYVLLLHQRGLAAAQVEHYPPAWPDATSAPRPQPLLYLLLRQAVLSALDPAQHVPTTEQTEFLNALQVLENRSTRELADLLAETLDLCSYRLDAWVTSLATRRLGLQRQQTELWSGHPDTVALGGYAWLEDVVPSTPAAVAGSGVFVHTPSLTHATTAAVLRSGYQTHRQSGGAFAVDLSSERVRRAQWLLDGVRVGQPLGALLGYRFERALHEKQLDQYVSPLRTLAALKGQDDLARAMQAEHDASQVEMDRAALVTELTDVTNATHRTFLIADGTWQQLRSYRDSRQAQRTTISDLQAKVVADQKPIADLDQQIADTLANRPETTTEDTAERDARGRPIPTLHVVDVQALAAWRAQLASLRQQRAAAAATYAADQAQLTAFEPLRQALDQELPDLNTRVAQLETDRNTANANWNAAAQQQSVAETSHRQAADALAAARTAMEDVLRKQWATAAESVPANNVVDGLELNRRWRVANADSPPRWDATTIPFGTPNVGLPTHATDVPDLLGALQTLADDVSAVGDAIVAESVHQLVQGNPLRSGATLEAIAGGDAPPPQLDVVRTPRGGTALTHRVVAAFNLNPAAAPPGASLRAAIEPQLNAWVGELLGNFANVSCGADLLDPSSGKLLETHDVALGTLTLSPLDLVYLAPDRDRPQQSELEQRLSYQVLRLRGHTTPASATVRLDFDRIGPGASLSCGQLLEMARTVRALLAGARPLDARDVAAPGSGSPLGSDLADLRRRADTAVEALRAAGRAVSASASASDLMLIRGALFGAAALGITGAIPLAAVDEIPRARETLSAQASSVAKEIADRLARLDQMEAAFPRASASAEAQRDHDVERVQFIFGRDFLVLPRTALPATDAATLNQTFAHQRHIGIDLPGAYAWLLRVARVREGAARFSTALQYAEALQTMTDARLRIGQLPNREPDRWVGLPVLPEFPLANSQVAIVAHLPDAFDFTNPFVGLALDEWVEVVPNRVETTGLTFQFPQPNSRAAQAVLIAVAPDVQKSRRPAEWDLDTFAAVVGETLDLCKLRTVRPDEVVWVEDALPDGATAQGDTESWTWIADDPPPYSGLVAHRSGVADGEHQHFFYGAHAVLSIRPGDVLFTYVYLDVAHPPRQVMLQWYDDSWEHRAYWGENQIGWGSDGTPSRAHMGTLPALGQWIRLEVPAATVNLEGHTVNGMAFTLFGGRATWDRSGVSPGPLLPADAPDNLLPGLWFTNALDFARATGTRSGD